MLTSMPMSLLHSALWTYTILLFIGLRPTEEPKVGLPGDNMILINICGCACRTACQPLGLGTMIFFVQYRTVYVQEPSCTCTNHPLVEFSLQGNFFLLLNNKVPT